MVSKIEYRSNRNTAAGEASSLAINVCSSKKSSPTVESKHGVLSKCPSSSSTITSRETAHLFPKLHDGTPDQRSHRSGEGDFRGIHHPLLCVYTTKEATKKEALSSIKNSAAADEKSCKTSHRLISSNKSNKSIVHHNSSEKRQSPMETDTEPNRDPLDVFQEETQRNDVDTTLDNEDPGFFEGAQRGFKMAYHDATSDIAYFFDTSNDRVWSL
jgi:hypothetical protein